MIYIIGPSHIHSNYTCIIKDELENKTLFANCILDAYRGIPNWSVHIFNSIKTNIEQNNNVCWIVSDYKFNNLDYPKIIEMTERDELFLDVIGHPGNVYKGFLQNYHIDMLGIHSLKVIDFIIGKFPQIKLIFWCLYKRTKASKNSSYPKHLWYDVVIKRYPSNIIDIDLFTDPNKFNELTIDKGGHPNKEGFELLDRMIMTAF